MAALYVAIAISLSLSIAPIATETLISSPANFLLYNPIEKMAPILLITNTYYLLLITHY